MSGQDGANLKMTITDTITKYVVYNSQRQKFLSWSGSGTFYTLVDLSDALRTQAFRTLADAEDFIDLVQNRHPNSLVYVYDEETDSCVKVFLKDEILQAVLATQTSVVNL